MRGCWFSKLGIKLEEKKFILENKTQYTQQEQHYKYYIFLLDFYEQESGRFRRRSRGPGIRIKE